MNVQEHIIKYSPVLAALVKPNKANKKQSVQKNDPYQKAIIKMIAALIAAEEKLLKAGVKNQEFQSQIHMTSSTLTTELSKKQRHEIKRAEEAKKHESEWDKIIHKLAPVIEVASIAITCTICPAMAPIALGLSLASQFGEFDKLCDALHIPKGLPRAGFKMLLIAGVSYGAGAAMSWKTTEEAGAEATEETSSKAAAKSSGRWIGASMAVPTINPTQDLIYGSLKAAGMNDREAKEIAGFVAGIVNLIASLALASKAKVSIPEGKFFAGKLGKFLNGLSRTGEIMLIGANIGKTYAYIKKGQAEMEQADVTDRLAKTKNGLEILEKVNSESSANIKQAAQNLSSLAKAFGQENKGFRNYTAAQLEEARLLDSQAV